MQVIADICIVLLCLTMLEDTMQCGVREDCTQRLGTGGQVQNHSPSVTAFLCVFEQKGSKGRKQLFNTPATDSVKSKTYTGEDAVVSLLICLPCSEEVSLYLHAPTMVSIHTSVRVCMFPIKPT